MAEHEVHRVDAREIAGIHGMLAADLRPRLGSEQARQGAEDPVQDRDARRVQAPAALLQSVAQIARHEGEDHHAGQGFDHAQHLIHLRAGAHERPDMLDRNHTIKLRNPSPGDRGHGFSGRVRDQVQMQAQGALSDPAVGKLGTKPSRPDLYPCLRVRCQSKLPVQHLVPIRGGVRLPARLERRMKNNPRHSQLHRRPVLLSSETASRRLSIARVASAWPPQPRWTVRGADRNPRSEAALNNYSFYKRN